MGRVEQGVVIIGAGRAGHALARALRRRNPTCSITLIAAHSAAVYPKSALPAALAANRDPTTLVQATAEMVAAREDLHLIEDSPVERIDLAGRCIEMGRGQIPYDRLVIAAGEAVGVPGALSGNPAVLALNRLADYQVLQGRLRSARRVLLLGAGVCACELANELARGGREPIVLDPARHPLGERVPGLAGRRLRQDLERAGVVFRLGERVRALEAIAHGRSRIHTACGERLDVEAVVSLIDPRPRIALARAAGLAHGRCGVAVDSLMRVAADGVFAIGACAALPPAIRHASVEAQARALAETLCGRGSPPESRPEAVRLNTPDAQFVYFEPPAIPGEWQERATPDGTSAAFMDSAGRLRGFALAGGAIQQSAAWLARLAIV